MTSNRSASGLELPTLSEKKERLIGKGGGGGVVRCSSEGALNLRIIVFSGLWYLYRR